MAGKVWKRVDGVLLLDKPTGMTSNAALQVARRLFSAAKGGHTGTLDPLASGLLPLCFGVATKFSSDVLTADKTYEAEVRFGLRTATGDAEGVVLKTRPVSFGLPDLEEALVSFRGSIQQVPPMYSALKKSGRPLYEWARQGIEVPREARSVVIHELRLLDYSGDRCRLHIVCSKGTYIRSLADELGERLASGAHLTVLRRIQVGALQVTNAVTLDELVGLSEEARKQRLLPPDCLLQGLPPVHLSDADGQAFGHGQAVDCVGLPGRYRVYRNGMLLGLGELDDRSQLRPCRVIPGA